MKKLLLILHLLPLSILAQDSTGVFRHLNTFSLQTGAGVGKYTLGIGNTSWVKNLELDILAGIVPEELTQDENWWIISTKVSWNSWNISKGKFIIRPIRPGVNLNFTLDDDIPLGNTFDSRYPSGYYWWSPAIRINFFIGSSFDIELKKGHRLALYHELGSNDHYLNLYFSNENYKVLSFSDILVWGFGLKWYLGEFQ